MKKIITIALLLIVSQASAAMPKEVTVWHDEQRGVTCWLFWGYQKGGISCLPDNSFQHPQQATPSSDEGRASPASSPSENGPLQATSLPQKKGFQL